MEWGWNPDTLEAAATSVAAAAAIIAGIFAWGAYRAERAAHRLALEALATEQQRDERALAEKERAQAEAVSAWTQHNTSDETLSLIVQNLSSAPIYSVRLGVVLGRIAYYAGWVRVLPPTSTPTVVPLHENTVPRWLEWRATHERVPTVLVEATYADAAGRWWFRNALGALREIDENDAYRYGSTAH